MAGRAHPSHVRRTPAPAERAAVAAAERAIGQSFPEPLVESPLRHDGMDHYDLLPPFWSLLGAQDIAEAWQRSMKICGDDLATAEEGDPEGEYGPWWHAQWIPFAANGAGDYLVIDQRPSARRGRIGTADHERGRRSRTTGPPRSRTLQARPASQGRAVRQLVGLALCRSVPGLLAPA
ncbi:SMI1/KNR4 family protein [Streptomyces spectabilis]|uniref:SMI1/KNR4 family protein n=1 Tax=Streptomyces spectabilis TaxID=68270 RepID=A0A516R1H9_STRST|nr:SMI1/KNR4 family protein [Streptomyces spectabilis]QDQ09513.1 SMI1/KNR4 family protein [Streptomyces spectabilis]